MIGLMIMKILIKNNIIYLPGSVNLLVYKCLFSKGQIPGPAPTKHVDSEYMVSPTIFCLHGVQATCCQ